MDEKEKIKQAREKYKPEKVKLLLIAEAPPKSADRFFYYENVKEHDHLFIEFVKALIEYEYDISMSDLIRLKKAVILQTLKKHGIFLMDLSDDALKEKGSERVYDRLGLKKSFIDKLGKEKSINKEKTNIILIKASVYDYLIKELQQEGYKVQENRLPFPSIWQQKNFRDGMHKIFEKDTINPICAPCAHDIIKLLHL